MFDLIVNNLYRKIDNLLIFYIYVRFCGIKLIKKNRKQFIRNKYIYIIVN